MMDGLAEEFELLVFCTHDVDTAARHASRVVVLREGRVALDGAPRDVLFDIDGLRAASILPTGAQIYASRLGVRALGVSELLRYLRPEG